jgi:hypothetical protein
MASFYNDVAFSIVMMWRPTRIKNFSSKRCSITLTTINTVDNEETSDEAIIQVRTMVTESLRSRFLANPAFHPLKADRSKSQDGRLFLSSPPLATLRMPATPVPRHQRAHLTLTTMTPMNPIPSPYV